MILLFVSIFAVDLLNTKMRENAKGRIFIAFFMVKTFHYHEEDAICHSDSGNSHDSSHQCPVCNFTLSPFTQVETLQLHIVLPVFDYQPEITVDKVCQVKSYPYYLRAPPVC